jgi:multiple sugar transport system substrate-binding protein
MTWEALIDQARKARAAGAKWGFSFDQVDRYYEMQPLYESAGAGPGLTGPGLMTPAITTPKWQQVTEWYGSIYADGTAPRGIEYAQIPSLFANGQIAFLVAGPWNLPIFERPGAAPFGIAPVPYFAAGKPATPTGSWAVGVSKYSRNRDAAIKFASFMALDKDGALLSTAKLPLPPASNAAGPPYYQHQTEAGGTSTANFTKIVQYELANTAVGRPRSIGYVAFEEIMNKMFSDVRNGAEAGPRLATAQDALVSAFSRIR